MDTRILTTADEDLKIAADILKNGGNVIFPTETVYGLGADAKSPIAVKNIFKAKGRPSDNPLIVHVSSTDMLDGIVEDITDDAKHLMDKFWPGPLTIILKKCKNVPYETTGGLDTVAVRMPKSEAARRLIELSGIPIAAPSANLSGKPSPTEAKHCIDDMMGRVDAIVLGEACEVGLESTVIDMSGEIPTLLRPGGVTLEQLREILGEVECVTKVKEGEKPKSPGLKYKHYSPEAEVVILSGSFDEAEAYIKRNLADKKVGLLTFDEFPKIDGVISISLGSFKEPKDAAHKLFGALREMDKMGADIVYAPEIPETGVWMAVRNRLYRAAGEKIVDVSDKKKILFVCTGNTCRSPMAEALFNHLAREKGILAEAKSAGVFASGGGVSQNSIDAMAELGIDISAEISKQISREMIDEADLILTMSQSHKAMTEAMFGCDKVYTLGGFCGDGEDISDPFGGNLDIYKACRDEIRHKIYKVLEIIK